MRAALSLMFVAGIALPPAVGQGARPPRLDELPKLAANWPPAWAALVREAAPAPEGYERLVLDGVGKLLHAEKPTRNTFQYADAMLSATLRHYGSSRQGAAVTKGVSDALQTELQDSLARVRIATLNHLRSGPDVADALALAERWMPTTPRGDALRTAMLQLWVEQARACVTKADFPTARAWLDRIDANFTTAKPADEIRQALRTRAETLLKESAGLPDAQAVRTLQEALELWPRLAEARDTLERRKQTYQTLRIAVRSLPEQLAPASACTEVEKQALELLFDRLYQVDHSVPLGKRYHPGLASALPAETSIALRRDAYWANGERVTAADVRHTTLLAANRSALWRDYLEIPRFEGNAFQMSVGYRQGLFDPMAPLTFWIVPQFYRGKQLERADDPEFARAPIGSGPFRYLGHKQDAGKPVAVFQANPYDLRRDLGSLRELRMMAWTDPGKDLARPLPHLALDVLTDQLAAFKTLGYTEIDLHHSSYVHFLAINQRRPSLAEPLVRRALASAIDRQTLLEKHFRSASMKGKYHTTANSLFPRSSWASCPAPRVPEELFQPEQARSQARKVKPGASGLSWTLKYADDDPRIKAACEQMAADVSALFRSAKIAIELKPVGLAPHLMQKAIHERDFDLAYTTAAGLDDPLRLALVLDPHPDAVKPGGANFLGEETDAKLQQLLRVCLQHRQFTVLREHMQNLHVHLNESMPAIPLWQLDRHVLGLPSLRVPPAHADAVFARIHEWKIQ